MGPSRILADIPLGQGRDEAWTSPAGASPLTGEDLRWSERDVRAGRRRHGRPALRGRGFGGFGGVEAGNPGDRGENRQPPSCSHHRLIGALAEIVLLPRTRRESPGSVRSSTRPY
ncbi:MAG: hypothetical protein MZU95_04965 [Desulfomicrobium escambiense]|nr:hypothetical protein [Desulfomicrobium escambiense]